MGLNNATLCKTPLARNGDTEQLPRQKYEIHVSCQASAEKTHNITLAMVPSSGRLGCWLLK